MTNPMALVVGVEKFAARELIGHLIAGGLSVYATGTWPTDWQRSEELKKLQATGKLFLGSIEGIKIDHVRYLFNFGQEAINGERFGETLRVINITDKRVDEKAGQRNVIVGTVYGSGMEAGENWLARLLVEAVDNKPEAIGQGRRSMLSASDLAEVLMRIAFLPGTEGRNYYVAGEQVPLVELSNYLNKEAGMTKTWIPTQDSYQELVSENEQKKTLEALGWQTKDGWQEEISKVLRVWFGYKAKGGWAEFLAGKKEYEQAKKIGVEKEHVTGETNRALTTKKEEVAQIKKAEVKHIQEDKQHSFEKVRFENSEPETLTEKDKTSVWEEERRLRIKKILEEDVELEPKTDPVKKRNTVPIQITPEPKLGGKERVTRKKTVRKALLRGGLIGLVLIPVLVVLTIGLRIYVATTNLKKFPAMVMSKNWHVARALANESQKQWVEVDKIWQFLGADRFGWGSQVAEGIYLGQRAALFAKETVDMVENSWMMWEKIWQAGEGLRKEDLTEWMTEAQKMDQELAYLQAQLGRTWVWWPKRWISQKQLLVSEIKAGREKWAKVQLMWPKVAELIGAGGKRRDYLILLQNEMELRPTGGFVGTLGIVTFQDGKFGTLEVVDVYSVDGQLKGHVEPPEELKKYLGEASWYLRDANWDPDFAGSATRIEWFYQKETGRTVDGVIAINLAAVKRMLEATGKVVLTDYNEEVSSENLFEQAEFYAENKFFPGSQQKANFLGLLAKQLLVEVKNMSADKFAKLLWGVGEALEEKQIQLYFNKSEEQELVQKVGWEGGIKESECLEEGCLADYLMIVEANVGVNKANYFIKRSLEEVVEITPPVVYRTVLINYYNTARSDAWPAGLYKSYTRVLVPDTVTILGIRLIDPDKGGEGERVEWLERRYSDKKEVSMLVKIPINSKRQLEIKYQSKMTFEGNDVKYMYRLQKQSGWEQTPLSLLVTAPTIWKPLQVQPAATLVGGKLLFSQVFNRDLNIGIEWAK